MTKYLTENVDFVVNVYMASQHYTGETNEAQIDCIYDYFKCLTKICVSLHC